MPGHADFLTSLAISVVGWKRSDGTRRYCAVRHGVLSVTDGRNISIATREAVTGDDLATLDETVLARFRADIETRAHGACREHAAAAERDPPDHALSPAGRADRRRDLRMTEPGEQDPLVKGVRLRGERHRRWLREGEPSVARRLAQIGVLGWIIVTPMLIGIFVGRWLDARFQLGTVLYRRRC